MTKLQFTTTLTNVSWRHRTLGTLVNLYLTGLYIRNGSLSNEACSQLTESVSRFRLTFIRLSLHVFCLWFFTETKTHHFPNFHFIVVIMNNWMLSKCISLWHMVTLPNVQTRNELEFYFNMSSFLNLMSQIYRVECHEHNFPFFSACLKRRNFLHFLQSAQNRNQILSSFHLQYLYLGLSRDLENIVIGIYFCRYL